VSNPRKEIIGAGRTELRGFLVKPPAQVNANPAE